MIYIYILFDYYFNISVIRKYKKYPIIRYNEKITINKSTALRVFFYSANSNETYYKWISKELSLPTLHPLSFLTFILNILINKDFGRDSNW